MKLGKDILELIEKMVALDYISKVKHPLYDLWIYKYTSKSQYELVWNEATSMCRGLVLDGDGNVIARPMKKFFNYEEIPVEQAMEIMSVPFQVTQKVDGSLGVLMKYNDEFIVATPGAFTSEQALFATRLVNTKYLEKVRSLDIDRYTYLFEVLYPENRIIVNYGDTVGLVFLAKIDKETGEDVMLSRKDFESMSPFMMPEVYDNFSSFSYKDLKSLNWSNAEGFVVHSEKGRLKIKFEKYITLHRLLSHLSEKTVWESMLNGTFYSLRKDVPEEILPWYDSVKCKFENEVAEVVKRVDSEYAEIINNLSETSSQKEFALAVLRKYKSDSGFLFQKHKGVVIDNAVLKSLKPKVEPFRKIDEE